MHVLLAVKRKETVPVINMFLDILGGRVTIHTNQGLLIYPHPPIVPEKKVKQKKIGELYMLAEYLLLRQFFVKIS